MDRKEKARRKELVKEGKELGLNLDEKMSVYELEHRIAEERERQQVKPKEMESPRKGEY